MKIFGTDGVRGSVGSDPITPDFIQKIAFAVGRYIKSQDSRKIHRRVVIGKDTRLSGYMIEPALASGFCALGLDVLMVGPMPTAGVSLLTQSLKADVGVMISASHNPYSDNGLKFFDHLGYKFSSKAENTIESFLQSNDYKDFFAKGSDLGRATRLEDARGRYMEYVKRTLPKSANLEGMKVAIDCANGAGYRIAPELFWEMGVEVVPIAVNPNGTNINKQCGAVYPSALQEVVKKKKCDAGIALDGDADRLVIVDEKGQKIEGDKLIIRLADIFQEQGNLRGGGIVGTSLTNGAVAEYMKDRGLKLHRANVGDRLVSEKMRELGINLGGEPSGHIIMSDFASCSDAVSTALIILAEAKRKTRPISSVFDSIKLFPSESASIDRKSVKNFSGNNFQDSDQLNKIIDKNKDVRIIIRPSGTEPKIRVMVEGKDKNKNSNIMNSVVKVLCHS